VDEIGRALIMHGKKGNEHMILVGRPEGKRPLGRPRCMWDNDIEMDLEEII
jgi:hypothetical protein